jgi:hypothetical protein
MYKFNNTESIIRLADGAIIPINPQNNDYKIYQLWLAAGNTAQPAQIPVPTRVTMRQARLALLGAGLLTTVNTAIAAMSGEAGEAARIEWEYSQEVHRDRGLVSALGTQLGMTEAQLDALFVTAAALP